MTRKRLVLVAQVAVVLGGAAVAASTVVDARGATRVTGPDRTVTSGEEDLGDISANNSPSLARNPRDPENLVVANRIDTPRYGCGLRASFDAGERWTRTRIPIPAGEQRKCFVPDVAFAADGTLHVLYVTLRGVGNVPNGLWLASSRDGGRRLSAPRRVAGRLAFQPRIAADPADPRRLFATWLHVREVGSLRFTGPGNPVVVSRSDDGGRTWGQPVPASAPARGRVLAPAPAVGARGELYVLFLDVGGDRLDYEGGHDAFGGPPYDGRYSLVLARSRDGGRTWAESVVDDRIVPVRRFVAFLPPAPSLAVHRASGRVHVAFHDARVGDADVRVWTLTADGRWRGVRVNDTPERDGTAQYLPAVAVAPDGRVDVVYYDRRGDERDRRNDVSLQSSFDEGRSFGARLRLNDRSFDSRIGALSERGLADLGSRVAVVAGPDGATAVWTDTRHGTEASNKQDLITASARLHRPTAAVRVAEPVLRFGGAALLVAGLVALVRFARRPVGAFPI